MQITNLLAVLLVLTAVAYLMARGRSVAMAQPLGGIRHLHSLPFFYGMRAAIWCAVPALVLLTAWLMLDDSIIRQMVLAGLPVQMQPQTLAEQNLLLNSIENIASGALRADSADPAVVAAAEHLVDLHGYGQRLMTASVLSLSVLGAAWG